jgi:glycine hydroxymethyltransferase
MSDIAHIAGLIAAGLHPDAVAPSDFVTGTTHKTMRGPRGGFILCKKKYADLVDQAVFPGIQGGPLMHVIAAKAVCFHEAMAPAFKSYAAGIVGNAKALAEELLARGWRLVSGGTDNHLLMIDLRSRFPDLTGRTAAEWLAAAGIIANKNAIPFDTRPPIEASGVRLGTPALTTRGMGPDQMRRIADWIDEILTSGGSEGTIRKVGRGVAELCRQFPIPSDGYE